MNAITINDKNNLLSNVLLITTQDILTFECAPINHAGTNCYMCINESVTVREV